MLAKTETDWLEYYLELWSDSMRRTDSHKLGYPSKSPYLQVNSSRAYDDASDLIADSVESYELDNIRACVESMPRELQLSLEFEYINKRVKAHVFRHPMLPESFEERQRLVKQAKHVLKRKLESRGMMV